MTGNVIASVVCAALLGAPAIVVFGLIKLIGKQNEKAATTGSQNSTM